MKRLEHHIARLCTVSINTRWILFILVHFILQLLVLQPKDIEGPKGAYVWHDKQIVEWVDGPIPSVY